MAWPALAGQMLREGRMLERPTRPPAPGFGASGLRGPSGPLRARCAYVNPPKSLSNVDFYRLTTFYRQFPNRASTSRKSGLRLGRVGIISWPLQKLLLPLPGQSSKTRFYNMLGKEDQSRKALAQSCAAFRRQTQKIAGAYGL